MASQGLQDILSKLIKGENLISEEVEYATELIASGKAESHQVAAFLTLLAAKGETAEEITAMSKVMRSHSTRVPIPVGVDVALDIVGTGGDGFNTVNISTAASILCSTCGVKVAKHGSTSVSSKSGSSDVLLHLMNRDSHIASPEKISTLISEEGYGFFFAPFFHPAMKHVVPVRKALKVRTVFNILGPLLSPLLTSKVLDKRDDFKIGMVLGVYSPSLLKIYAEVIKELGVDHALVVHGSGMDELNSIGVVDAFEVRKGEPIKEIKIDPTSLGLPLCTVDDLRGGDPLENMKIIRQVFTEKSKRTDDGKYDRLRETIALNAAAGLYVTGTTSSIQDGLELALATIDAGEALIKLESISKSWAN